MRADTGADGLGAAPGSALQPVFAGGLAAFVGFAGAFTVVLQGLASAGATPVEAASGLLALCVVTGLAGIVLSTATRLPISIAWSTPGAALLTATGVPAGGFPAAVGAFLLAAALFVLAGIWRPFGRAVAGLPVSIASAMLAGILLDICLAPARAVGALPGLALPVVVAWALAWRFARLYAVPVATLVAALVIAGATTLPPLAGAWPHPVLVVPTWTFDAAVGIGLPLFVVTMASQNVPGLAVLAANGYRPRVGPLFVATGLASALTAPFCGHVVNLAAITAALCAGPEAHPDPGRRWIATTTAGGVYIVLGLGAALAAAFVAASPPLLIQTVAGLALLGSLAGSLATALAREEERVPAILAFVTSASGLSFLGIGAAFWGLVAGGALLALARLRSGAR